jgi:ligand-binding sensor domain-containing protein
MRIIPLFLALIFVSSCSGQTKKAQAEQISFTSKNKKLTKTQASDKFQNVYCIVQDKGGDLWFGTTGEGVYRYDGKEFIQFTTKDGLGDNTVWSIIEDRLGNIWFGTNDGISLYNGRSISKVILPMRAPIGVGNAGPQSIKNAVWSMMQDRDGMIWLGTDYGVYNYNGRDYTYFLNSTGVTNKTGLTLKSIQCMFQDKNGNIWFGSGPQASEGIILFDGKSLTNYKPQDEGWIRKIAEDKNGALLFVTRHYGLIAYNGNSFSAFPQPGNLKKQLLATILVDSKGDIWYSSDYTNSNDVTTGGLWKFDGRSFVEFTKKDGLGNTSVFSLKEDRSGNIWIGTRNCGLYRYNGITIETFSE